MRTCRGVFAVENRCPHVEPRHLADPSVSGCKLTCAGHGQRFDLAAGRPEGRLAARTRNLRAFHVTIADGRLWLSPKEPA